jgi:hypothetical protein
MHLFAYCRFSVLLLVLIFTAPHASVTMSSTVTVCNKKKP